MSIYTSAFFDNNGIHNVIDGANENQNSFSFFIKNILKSGDRKSNKQHYEARTKILYELYSQFYKTSIYENENVIEITCSSTFGPFLKKMLLDIDDGILSSMLVKRICAACNREFVDRHALMELKFVDKINLKRLSNYINLAVRNAECRKCGNRLETIVEYGNVLAFDVEPLTEKHMTTSTIDDIQQTLHIEDRVYKLFGVVEFLKANNHFIAHVKRSNGVWETYDDLQKEVSRSKNCSKKPMVVFAVFYMVHNK